mmetsp:Transcript_970/g.2790  ORF Transcript_970/g.2790 Transcript_970/m.2790 type:complete len:368 (+) Transcript_970:105-1208(+)
MSKSSPTLASRAASLLGMRYAADFHSLTLVALYFVTTWFMWTRGDSLGVFWYPAWVVMTYLSFSGAIMTHNTMHCAVFRTASANKVFQVLLTLMYGHPVSSYVPGHNLSHHKHTETPKDLMRTTKMRYRWNLLNLLLFHFTVAGSVLRSDVRYLQIQRELRRPFFYNCMREFFVLMAVQLVLLPLDWRKFLVLWYLPHFLAQYCIVTINLLQHGGTDVASQETLETILTTTRCFTGSVTNFLCLNNGYHTIHHLRPYLHWSLCKEAHEKEIAPHLDPRLDEPNMITYIWRSYIYPGRRVDFRGNPVTFDGPEPEDEMWVEPPEGVTEEQVRPTLGNFVKTVVAALPALPLIPFKLMSPLYSPVHKLE